MPEGVGHAQGFKEVVHYKGEKSFVLLSLIVDQEHHLILEF